MKLYLRFTIILFFASSYSQSILPDKFELDEDSILNKTFSLGLKSNSISEIVFQGESKVWLGTGRGISYLVDSVSIYTLDTLLLNTGNTYLMYDGISGIANFKDHIVFAGVGKSDDEITYAIKKDISYFNCESLQELEVINQLAKNLLKKISISIRINPNIKTETHKKIQTGFRDNKFGIDINDVNYIPSIIKKLKNIHLVGIHFHLGSQISSNEPFIKLCKVANDINEFLSDKSINIKFINVGGGLYVNYNDPLNDTFPNFKDFFTLYN